MRTFVFVIASIVFALSLSFGISAATEQLAAGTAANFARACRYTSANIQIVTATGAATGSTQTMNAGSAYKVLCTTDTRFRETSTVGATGALLKANTVLDVWAKSGDYMSVLADATGGQCNVTECN